MSSSLEVGSSLGFFFEVGTKGIWGHAQGKDQESDPRKDTLLEEALRTQNELFESVEFSAFTMLCNYHL